MSGNLEGLNAQNDLRVIFVCQAKGVAKLKSGTHFLIGEIGP